MMAAPTADLDILTRFVTFYSYKGGVGRTLALANCARALAAKGKKIVLLDLDLEAPGLLHFDAFHPKKRVKSPAGFAEYLATCLQHGPPAELDDYIHKCQGKANDKGTIWLMPAGRDKEQGYLSFLNGTTWNDFYTQQDGYKILENLRGHIIARFKPDYVLIDARTGLSEIGGIATHQLADIVVLVFNLNGQNIKGAKRVFDSIRTNAPLHPKIILVASPVPVMPTEKGTPFAKKMQAIRTDFTGAYNDQSPLIIPYHPLLAFEDRLLVDDGDVFSSDAPYRRLAEAIQQVAEVDADFYLQQMVEPMQRGDWQRVKAMALQGLEKNKTDIYLLFNLALAYHFTDEPAKLVTTIDEILQYHANTTELSKQELVAQSLCNKGFALHQLQRQEEAIAVYEELLRQFGGVQEVAFHKFIATALCNKGAALDRLQRYEEAITAYNELLRRFGCAQEDVFQGLVANTLCNKGVALSHLQRHEEAITAYDELLLRFGGTQEEFFQGLVANALCNKGIALSHLQRHEEAITVYDELLLRFGGAQKMLFQESIAKALSNKGVALQHLQRNKEAIAVCDELLQRFGSTQEASLKNQVARASNGKGFYILLQAKEATDNPEQKRSLLERALDNFEQAVVGAATEDHAIILGNQAYALFLLGRTVDSEQVLKTALTLGGQGLYEAELADSHINPVPEDEAFRLLLEALWQETQAFKA